MIIHDTEKMTHQEIQIHKDGQRLGVVLGIISGFMVGITIGFVIATFIKCQ